MRFKNKTTFFFLFLFGVLFAQKDIQLLEKIKLLSRTIITETGYCSDGSDRFQNGNPRFYGPMEAKVISYKNYQYVAYYESNGDVVVARKKTKTNSKWEKSIIQGYKIKSQDRHNKIAIVISQGDGVIHLSFDHHNTPKLNYACSKLGAAKNPELLVWDDSVFSLLPNLGLKNEMGLVTYPSFYPVNATGDIIIYWRTGGAIGGEMNLANYNSKDHQWRFIGEISTREGVYLGNKGSRGPYHAGFETDVNGTLHLAWLWREDFKLRNDVDGIGNHGIYYAESPNGGFTWFNSEGIEVGNVNTNVKMSIDNMGKVPIEVPMTLNPTNVGFTSTIDSDNGNFVCMLTQNKKETNTRVNFLYTRNLNGKWTSHETTMNGEGELVFFHDVLFFMYQKGVFYATRANNFENWKRISFPVEINEGEINWDTGQLDKGIISMAIQYTPKVLGQPSSIEFFNFKIAK